MLFDLILIDGRIWTENPAQPEGEALGIICNKIAQVGTSEEILKGRHSETKVIALNGRRVVPGFNDAHVHFYLGGASLNSVQLRDATSPQEFRQRVADFARTQPKGEWILLGSWDPELWPSGELPTCGWIDDITPDHPVFLNRVDAHTSLANSQAMRLAGVSRDTPDVPGGEIGRKPDGSLTGIFKDAAQTLISRVIPPPTKARMVRVLDAAQKHAARHGVTSVQDMGLLGSQALACSADLLRAYQELDKGGELKVRVSLNTPLRGWKQLANLGIEAGFGHERLRVGGIKAFADGSLGSTTAWFLEPYAHAPFTCGIPSDDMSDPEWMLAELIECDRAGLQLAIHAIGDRANRQVLNFFQQIERQNGAKDRRWRIEHAQHLHPDDIPRFAKQKVIASVQPSHLSDDGRWADTHIGRERAHYAYPFRSLLDEGAILALGSDWWVAPLDPLLTIWAATTRETFDGAHAGGWVPEQKISVKETVHGYTVGAAYASGEEDIKGSLQPGKLADLAVLSDDIFNMELADIRHVHVDMTVFDGRIIYEHS